MLAIEMALLQWAPQIETDAKHNAPWQDQTGNARQRLEAHVDKLNNDTLQLILMHRVAYGPHLELGYGGKYKIIMPTLEMYYARVWADVKRVMK